MNASLASASAAMSINDDKAIDNKNGRCFLMCIFPRVKLLNSRPERRPPGPDPPVPAYEYSLAEVPVKQRLGLQFELPGLDNRSTCAGIHPNRQRPSEGSISAIAPV